MDDLVDEMEMFESDSLGPVAKTFRSYSTIQKSVCIYECILHDFVGVHRTPCTVHIVLNVDIKETLAVVQDIIWAQSVPMSLEQSILSQR